MRKTLTQQIAVVATICALAPITSLANDEPEPSENIANRDDVSRLTITEVLANPEGADANNEFIELYNPTDKSVSLAEITLTDASGKNTFAFGASDKMKAGEYRVLIHGEDFLFSLNNSGDKLTLSQDSTTITVFTYTKSTEGQSWNTSTLPEGEQYETNPTPGSTNEPDPESIVYPELEINEIFPDPIGSDEDLEFIEIKNATESEIDLAQWSLTVGDKVYEFTSERGKEVLPPNKQKAYYSRITKLSLRNSEEETVTLKNPRGENVRSVTYTNTREGQSFSKEIAASDTSWKWTAAPTPNEPNSFLAQEVIYPIITINEFLAYPPGGDSDGEFIELKNPTDGNVSLSDWTLQDESGEVYTLPMHAEIPAEGHYTIFGSLLGFSLNKTGGDKITLTNPRGESVSIAEYAKTQEGESHIIIDNAWFTTFTPTPNAINIANEEDALYCAPGEHPEKAEEPVENQSEEIESEETPKAEEEEKTYLPLHLNELFPNPAGSDATSEFIELVNPHSEPQSLEGWSLRDGSANGRYTFGEDTTIPAQGYFALYRGTFTFALNNSGSESLTLEDPNGIVTDTFTYSGTKENISYARKGSAWLQTSTPTPGAPNTFPVIEVKESKEISESYPLILLTELLPSPKDGAQEYIELTNPTDDSVNLKDWIIRDSSKNGSHTFDATTTIDPGEYIVITRDTYGFALNNSGTETVTLEDPSGTIRSATTYKSAPSGVSYGWTGDIKNPAWRFTLTQTPTSPNIFGEELRITDIEISHPYQNTQTTFEIDVEGVTGDEFSVKWNFGNGKISNKKEATHSYKKTGTYFGVVSVTDSTSTITKQFDIKIKELSKKDVQITAVMPNPIGKDSGLEYIIITNKEDKKVKLEGWSLATGKDDDSVRNHPFKKSITLDPDESKRITAKHAAISLGNDFGYVELRLPDGRDVDGVTYDYNDAKTTPEGALYQKEADQWVWHVPNKGKSKEGGESEVLSEQERMEIINSALANMETFDEDVTVTQEVEIVEETTPRIPKRSIWQHVKDGIKSFFKKDAEEVTSYPVAKRYHTSTCYSALIAKAPLESICSSAHTY